MVRALRASQGDNVPVYAFFLLGSDVTKIADISRIHSDDAEALRGFQRKEIREHVNSIVEFLNGGPVIFPNALILALSPKVDFRPKWQPTIPLTSSAWRLRKPHRILCGA